MYETARCRAEKFGYCSGRRRRRNNSVEWRKTGFWT